MASKKPQYQIPAPSTGVRKDVDPMLIDQTMAADGANFIYFDGTLRPRPALDVQVENYIEIGNWQKVFDGDTQAGDFIAGDDGLITVVFQSDDSSYIVASIKGDDDSLFIVSRDGGQTWAEASIGSPDTSYSIYDIRVVGEYVYCCGFARDYSTDIGPPVVITYFDTMTIWRTDLSTFPDSGAWSEVASEDFLGTIRSVRYFYDDERDIYFLVGLHRNESDTERKWATVTVYDASTELTSSDSDSSADLNEEGITALGDAIWVDGKILFTFYPQSGSGFSGYGIRSEVLEIDEGVLKFAFGENTSDFWLHRNENGVLYNPLGIPSADVPSGGASFPSAILYNKRDAILFMYSGASSLDEGYRFVGSVDYEDGEFSSDGEILIDVNIEGVPQGAVSAMTDEKIVFSFDLEDVNLIPTCFVSSDAGKTFMQITGSEDLGYDLGVLNFYFNNESNQHFASFSLDNGATSVPYIYLMPTSAGESSLGGVSSIYQVDLDDEEDALIVGTTSALARLNKDTNNWERITANQLEYIDGKPGDEPEGPYTPDGVYTWDYDIPPLSVAAGDPDYVSGLTIDTVYGQNPWVFRAFEASGKTFLLATNGQCYPLVYHSEMNGGFARRMGEVPTTNDPNYREILPDTWDYDNGWLSNGNLAPRGRCMAVAANRVILANNPTGSPFEVNVGGFNDMDRGWGTTNSQLVLLGDTAGEIITMEEISALQVAIYKEDAIYHAIAQTEFLGVSAPFRFELAKAGISGPCSPASVLRNFDGRQIYLARDGGVYMYDGVAPLDGGRNIRRMIQNDIDLNNLGKCWGMVDHQRKLVWFFYPGRNQQINKGIVISTDQGYPWPTWPVELPTGWNFTCGAEINLSNDAAIGDLGEFGTYNTETLSSFNTGQTAMITGRETGVFFTQKWNDDGDYSDSGLPIKCKMTGGWLSPGGLQIHTADELYHIFSSPDPEQEILVRLRAQKIGQNIVSSPWRTLTAGKPRRRTRHRVGGVQFGIDLKADATRMFSWAGAIMTASNGGRNRG